jgi:AAA+ ATPase superfamily predicted ATPase
VLQQLLDAALLHREIPFGESLRTTKRIHYRIADPAIRFWFRIFSPNRTAWGRLSKAEKNKLLRDHAAGVFEDWWRESHEGAGRLWDATAEFDSIRSSGDGVVVTEVKFKTLSEAEKEGLLQSLSARWARSAFSKKYAKAEFEVIDASALR